MLAIKSPSHVQAREDYDMEQTSDEQNLVFESVLDVEFDPARPKRFLSSGNDMKVLAWNLEEIPTNLEETPKELCVTSLPALTKHFNAQPHHICFSPSRSHWGTEQARTSTVAISDSEGKINIECFTRETIVCSVDKHPGRQVSSLCWGFNRTENVVFGGTEYSDFKGGIAAGSQAGFLVLPNGDRSDGKYTNSQDEVEQLALNPQGDIIASLTKTCDRSNIRCAGRLTRKKQNPNLIGSVELPAFASSDRIDEAGSVVSLAWSPCGTYIAVSRDDDFIDVFDSRLLVPQPLMRLKHETPNVQRMKRPAVDLQGNASRCCRVSCKFPEHGVTGMRWVEGTGYYGGLGLVSGGSDGCVRLWDIRQVDSNIILAHLETEVASMSIGDVSERECPLIVGDNDGLVQLFATNPYGGTPLC
ncbi:hypothetical protein FRC17_000820 [Serendipita sp. 399]|nr:hypothetical protein FRC17_000820 [Serendipita sp. 399]